VFLLSTASVGVLDINVDATAGLPDPLQTCHGIADSHFSDMRLGGKRAAPIPNAFSSRIASVIDARFKSRSAAAS
jgi:hypothetical protein